MNKISLFAFALLSSCIISIPLSAQAQASVNGKLTVTLPALPANNSNIKAVEDVPVYALTTKAAFADVVVDSVDLEVSSSKNDVLENPAILINTIKVWDGSILLASYPVGPSTFLKDSTAAYYARLNGLNFLVPKDATKTLTITFSVNSIDEHRTVKIDGYKTTSLTAVSGKNVVTKYNINNLLKTHTFRKVELLPVASSSKAYIINTPQSVDPLFIGSPITISWARPINAMARTAIRLQNIPDASKRIGLQQFVIAKGVSANSYTWTIPSNIAQGTYKLIVGPDAGNGGPSVAAGSMIVSILKRLEVATTTPPVATTSTDAVLTVLPLAQPILPNAYVISPDDGARHATFNGFTVKSEGGNSALESVSVKVSRVGSSSLPTTVYLWDRSGTLYASKNVTGDGTIVFDNVLASILNGRTMDFLVKADMASNAIPGSAVMIDVTNVTAGSGKIVKNSLPIPGPKMTFVQTAGVSGVANYQLAGNPTITSISDRNGINTTGLAATFPLSLTAVGGSVAQPKASDYVVIFESASTTILSPSISVVTIPNNSIAASSTSLVTITAAANGSKIKVSGLYRARLLNIKTFNGFTDIDTMYTSVNAPIQSGGITTLSASVGLALRMAFGSIVGLFGF